MKGNEQTKRVGFLFPFSAAANQSNTLPTGIVFTVRIFNGFGGPNGEPASEDDFIHRRIKYTPLHLDKEPEVFVGRLKYMGDSFTFPCAQQGLFLNSLRETIRDAVKDTSESGSDIEGMEVEDHDSQP